jgi:hypothetical protein
MTQSGASQDPDDGQSSDWLALMLEEIARREAEAREDTAEAQRRSKTASPAVAPDDPA